MRVCGGRRWEIVLSGSTEIPGVGVLVGVLWDRLEVVRVEDLSKGLETAVVVGALSHITHFSLMLRRAKKSRWGTYQVPRFE